MTSTFAQIGGARIGSATWPLARMNASSPFARLSADRDAIVLRCLFKFTFPRDRITRLSIYRGLLSFGLLVEHPVPRYPGFMLFWTSLEAAGTIARHRNLDLAILGQERLRARPVAAVAFAASCRIALLIAEMLGHGVRCFERQQRFVGRVQSSMRDQRRVSVKRPVKIVFQSLPVR
jgi:hypothetical protein